VVAAFLRDRSGATAIEYGLIVLLIFLAIVGAIRGFGNSMTNMYTKISNTAGGAM
jgi:pilus assembly protein Flp/PilA